MASLPASSSLGKLNVFISLIALFLYCFGGLENEWITTTFKLPPMPPQIPASLTVEVHMGLIKSCNTKSVTGTNKVIEEDCTSDGAADWQKAAVGVACVGGFGSLVAFVLLVLNVTVHKTAGLKGIKLAAAATSFVSAVGMTIALVLYTLNKKIQVDPSLPLQVEFDLSWAYSVSAAAAGFQVVLAILAVIDCFCKPYSADFKSSNYRDEMSVHYSSTHAAR